MALEPSPAIWVHGLLPLPGTHISEKTLLYIVEKAPRVASTDRTVGLDQWVTLSGESLGLTRPQAVACMRLCFVLWQSGGSVLPMPTDEALRVPLGSLLLLLWVQWAHHELGEGSATNTHRAQAASGEVWPSLLHPPAAAASAVLLDSGSPQSARSLAVQARLHNVQQIGRRRRKLLQVHRAERVACELHAVSRHGTPLTRAFRALCAVVSAITAAACRYGRRAPLLA